MPVTDSPFYVSSVSYCYEIAEDDFLLVMKQEEWASTDTSETIMDKLHAFDASNVEYNGHFGPNIFFTISGDDDCLELHEKIKKMIDDHLEGLRNPPKKQKRRRGR